MKKVTVFFKMLFITGFCIKLNAQTKVLVLDNITKSPIPFATIIYENNLGTYTNEKGTFLIDNNFEKLIILSIGYKKMNLYLKEIKDTIWMTGEPINLNPVVLTPISRKISYSKVGMKSSNDFHKSFFCFVGNEISTLILGNPNASKSYLKSIKIPTNASILKASNKDNTKVKVVNDSFCSVFQIQFYKNENEKPGKFLNYEDRKSTRLNSSHVD